jgi:hypothetical protein
MKTSQKLSVVALCCAAFAVVALCSSQARADLPQKTFRLHLESGLFSLQRGEIDWDDMPNDWDLDLLGAGIGMPQACVGLGFVVWRGLVIGGRVETAFYDDEYETGDVETFELAILPYGEYAFLTGLFRPFVTIYLGVRGRAIDYGRDEFDMWGFATGGGGGAHIFLFDRFSIDLTLLLGVEVGGADWDPGGPGDDDGDYVMFDMSILVGLSGWI